MLQIRKLTIKTSQNIAKKVLRYIKSGIDPRSVNINDLIDGYLAEIGLGWKLKSHTYIDGLSCQFIKDLSKDIRLNSVEKY